MNPFIAHEDAHMRFSLASRLSGSAIAIGAYLITVFMTTFCTSSSMDIGGSVVNQPSQICERISKDPAAVCAFGTVNVSSGFRKDALG